MDKSDAGRLTTRRCFLGGLATSVAGLSAVGLSGCSHKDQSVTSLPAELSISAPPKLPFAYVKIDSDKAAEMTYKGYFKGG